MSKELMAIVTDKDKIDDHKCADDVTIEDHFDDKVVKSSLVKSHKVGYIDVRFSDDCYSIKEEKVSIILKKYKIDGEIVKSLIVDDNQAVPNK